MKTHPDIKSEMPKTSHAVVSILSVFLIAVTGCRKNSNTTPATTQPNAQHPIAANPTTIPIKTITKASERTPGSSYIQSFVFASSNIEIEMIWVPAGSFIHQTTSDGSTRTQEIRVRGFWMSKNELPWQLVCDWCARIHEKTIRNQIDPRLAPIPPYINPGYQKASDKNAAATLTQYCAQQLCVWISEESGKLYRLPTEAEWEYAARAGSKTDKPEGIDLKKIARFGQDRYDFADDIGLHQPNPSGLRDMLGNMAEWTLDGWSDHPWGNDAVVNDPWTRRSETHPLGVVRGGDWTSPAADMRFTMRKPEDDMTDKRAQLSDWWDDSDDGMRAGLRIVSPASDDPDDRATYIEPGKYK